MNKEEVDKFCKEYYGFTLEDVDGSIGYWMGKYQELEQENKELKEKIKVLEWDNNDKKGIENSYIDLWDKNRELHNKIDKAIEFIEKHKRKDEFLNLNEWQTRELLEILKDSDVDE